MTSIDTLIFASAVFAAGVFLGSRWQYRRILRQIYDSAGGDSRNAR